MCRLRADGLTATLTATRRAPPPDAWTRRRPGSRFDREAAETGADGGPSRSVKPCTAGSNPAPGTNLVGSNRRSESADFCFLYCADSYRDGSPCGRIRTNRHNSNASLRKASSRLTSPASIVAIYSLTGCPCPQRKTCPLETSTPRVPFASSWCFMRISKPSVVGSLPIIQPFSSGARPPGGTKKQITP